MLLIFPLKCTRRKCYLMRKFRHPLLSYEKNREVPLLAGIGGSPIQGLPYIFPHLMAARARKPAIGGNAKTLGMKSKSTQGFPATHGLIHHTQILLPHSTRKIPLTTLAWQYGMN